MLYAFTPPAPFDRTRKKLIQIVSIKTVSLTGPMLISAAGSIPIRQITVEEAEAALKKMKPGKKRCPMVIAEKKVPDIRQRTTDDSDLEEGRHSGRLHKLPSNAFA
ncbi:unnamed protein product [Heligmosomoides polygyrus]|uniref:Uncharacterized protein n=1 Tax=Heligmosomoides polygyrus TaxID=6339 RepID=A0A183G9J1_HELPZ|nr:unnamed protein product [Heligmosomoides polygyrus]